VATERQLVEEALPNYEIGDELGRGAFGIVLSGRHRALGRLVAIKQLPRAFSADPSVRDRFVSESRVLASFEHPHIAPVYDFVEYEGLCLLVMEQLTGGTLWARVSGDGLGTDEACVALLATATALQYAHERGVLHRDVKPENLLFSENRVLKLTDFGIAKLLADTPNSRVTATGMVIGTPAYMAPEQATGGTIGPYTDVYATGIMGYELLAGVLPFSGAVDSVTTLLQHVQEEPRPLRDVAPAVPPEVAEVIHRALVNARTAFAHDSEALEIDYSDPKKEVMAGAEKAAKAEARKKGLPSKVTPFQFTVEFHKTSKVVKSTQERKDRINELRQQRAAKGIKPRKYSLHSRVVGIAFGAMGPRRLSPIARAAGRIGTFDMLPGERGSV
jgi:serine/threonine protein kinase